MHGFRKFAFVFLRRAASAERDGSPQTAAYCRSRAALMFRLSAKVRERGPKPYRDAKGGEV